MTLVDVHAVDALLAIPERTLDGNGVTFVATGSVDTRRVRITSKLAQHTFVHVDTPSSVGVRTATEARRARLASIPSAQVGAIAPDIAHRSRGLASTLVHV